MAGGPERRSSRVRRLASLDKGVFMRTAILCFLTIGAAAVLSFTSVKPLSPPAARGDLIRKEVAASTSRKNKKARVRPRDSSVASRLALSRGSFCAAPQYFFTAVSVGWPQANDKARLSFTACGQSDSEYVFGVILDPNDEYFIWAGTTVNAGPNWDIFFDSIPGELDGKTMILRVESVENGELVGTDVQFVLDDTNGLTECP